MNNNSQNQQQYVMSVNGQNATSGGMSGVSSNAMNASRSKMNSTMMVKFNSSTEKNLNQRGNLNKSTLLPNNMVAQTGNQHLANSRNPEIKMNIAVDNDQNL
jgi:hypothetical protein